ncbi:MAG: YraN family protein [Acidimicrobiales bacterium]
MTAGRRRTGCHGEDRAAAWYSENGFTVVARNWRCDVGEIDVIVRRGPLLVVAEVKTRTSDRFGHPAEAVDHRKQRRLRRLAARWLAESGEWFEELRFDVVAVTPRTVEVIPAAF